MAIPFTSQSRCWPGGVPGQLLSQPMYFLRSEASLDDGGSAISLTDKHSEVKPSWFGNPAVTRAGTR
jgi:hypothetical protein